MNYQTVSDELKNAQYTSLGDSDAANLLNAKNISIKKAVSSSDIRKYLLLVNKLIALEASQDASAIESNRALDLFTEFNVSETLVEAKLIALLDSLVIVTLINSSDKSAILEMAEKTISRAGQLGLPVLVEANINFARSL